MLTPSDKTALITKIIKVLNITEGIEQDFIDEVSQLLTIAEEEEVVYHIEQEAEIKTEAERTYTITSEKDVDNMNQHWEDRADAFIQNQIDIARGK